MELTEKFIRTSLKQLPKNKSNEVDSFLKKRLQAYKKFISGSREVKRDMMDLPWNTKHILLSTEELHKIVEEVRYLLD